MTLAKAPLAIDGVLTPSSMVRKGIFGASGNPAGGVVGANHFKVSPTSPEGPGLLVAGGVAMVPNGYQTTPDELYTVPNNGVHTVQQSDMPSASGSTTYWLVCLVIGDPSYSNSGHPFMPSTFDSAQANTFQYNRIVLFPCGSGTTSFTALGKSFPGLALARLAIPPSTTTINASMITDVREMVRSVPGRWNAISNASLNVNTVAAPADIPGASVTVQVGGSNEVFDVDINDDVYCTGTVINFTDLMIDGVSQGDSIIAQQGAHVNSHGMWTVTGLSPGNHVFKVTSYNYAGSTGSGLHSAGSTKLRIRRI